MKLAQILYNYCSYVGWMILESENGFQRNQNELLKSMALSLLQKIAGNLADTM